MIVRYEDALRARIARLQDAGRTDEAIELLGVLARVALKRATDLETRSAELLKDIRRCP